MRPKLSTWTCLAILTACWPVVADASDADLPRFVLGLDAGPALQDHEPAGIAQARASLFPNLSLGVSGRLLQTVGGGRDATAATANLGWTWWGNYADGHLVFEANAGYGHAWLDGAGQGGRDDGPALRAAVAYEVLPDGRKPGLRWELSWLRVDLGDEQWDAPALTCGVSWILARH